MWYNVCGDFRMDEQFVSIGKAAKMLGMSTEGLRKWEREGRLIPVRTLTRHRRYRVADLHTLMQGHTGRLAINPLYPLCSGLYQKTARSRQS